MKKKAVKETTTEAVSKEKIKSYAGWRKAVKSQPPERILDLLKAGGLKSELVVKAFQNVDKEVKRFNYKYPSKAIRLHSVCDLMLNWLEMNELGLISE